MGFHNMKQERVVLSFIMVFIGLLVAGALFYFYQSTKNASSSNIGITKHASPTPTPKPKTYLSLSKPSDEAVMTSKTLEINGKTNPEATVIIITAADQEVLQPSSQGNFSTTITLDNGQNLIKIYSIMPDGETISLDRTVTYSTENF
jgi:hypothetical protein